MPLYETLIRLDFLIAVGLLVVGPLALLGLSLHRPWIRDRLLSYWRASALLGITVYLWIDELAIGFLTGYAARLFIPVALWWGDALSTRRSRTPPTEDDWIGALFRHWRLVATIYSGAGLVYMAPLLLCIGSDVTASCSTWYVPPQEYARLLHPYTPWADLGLYGRMALAVYAGYAALSAYALLWRPLRRSPSPDDRDPS